MNEQIEAVKKIHSPDDYGDCQECYTDYGAETWPCRTAEAVFTVEEINAAKYNIAILEERRRAEQPKITSPISALSHAMREVYSEQLWGQLNGAASFMERFGHAGRD